MPFKPPSRQYTDSPKTLTDKLTLKKQYAVLFPVCMPIELTGTQHRLAHGENADDLLPYSYSKSLDKFHKEHGAG
jgi:hypothetical protein